MTAQKRAGAFTRRYWKHLIAGHAAIAVGLLVAFLVGAFAGPTLYTVFGKKLDKKGVQLYHGIVAKKVEKDQRAPAPVSSSGETLPAAQAAKVAALNDQVAAGISHPHPLATPQPSTGSCPVRNYSTRSAGAHPILLVAHDTESPNAPGTQDILAICTWFNNPVSQASSNDTTDADGNTLAMVPCSSTAKAWTQAWFNSWACSDEMIGHASQTTWPDAQLRAVAEIFAAWAKEYGIPIQIGAISGCTIVRPGIVDHAMLGACGGGHHDNGPHFPLAHFVALVHGYAVGGYHPVAPPKPKPVNPAVAPVVLRAKTGFYSWLAWRLGEQAWKGYGKTNPTVRPNVPRAVPNTWWAREVIHLGGH